MRFSPLNPFTFLKENIQESFQAILKHQSDLKLDLNLMRHSRKLNSNEV